MLSSLPCRVGRSDEGGNSQCKGLEVETSWGRVAGQSGRQSLWLLWVEWEGLAGADRVGLELRQFTPVAMVAEPWRLLGEAGCLPRKREQNGRGAGRRRGCGKRASTVRLWEGPQVGAGRCPWPLLCWNEDPQVPTSSL